MKQKQKKNLLLILENVQQNHHQYMKNHLMSKMIFYLFYWCGLMNRSYLLVNIIQLTTVGACSISHQRLVITGHWREAGPHF